MKNFKRIVSFVMAMVIFASFFCYNIGASGNPNYARYEYSGRFVHARFSDTSAYAFVTISNWAEEENSTDLRASTNADIVDYEDLISFYEAVVYVDLVVWLEDGSENRTSDIGYVDIDDTTVAAFVHGRNCLNDNDHYSIDDFESSHKVELTFYIEDLYGNILDYYTENDGPIIEISTMD